ncbi:MAG: hypothetical protein WCO09_00560 [bacterium]
MEMVRTALEVLYGKRVTYNCIDFNTNHGEVSIGDEVIEIVFTRDRDDLISLRIKNEWYSALFETPALVRVGTERGDLFTQKTVAGELPMRWAGHSAAERWEEPLFLEQAKHYAQIRGLNLQQLLKGGTEEIFGHMTSESGDVDLDAMA